MTVTDRLNETTYYQNNQLRRVRYFVIDTKVYFSGVEFPSSINAAESIVQVISNAEGVHWSELTFYDLQTHAGGYRPHDESYYCMDQLVLEANGDWPIVKGWIPQGLREYGIVQERFGNLTLPGIPEQVRIAFGIQ